MYKCIMAVDKDDLKSVARNFQVCAGQQTGWEAAIHAMREIYSHEECEAVLLVDKMQKCIQHNQQKDNAPQYQY